MDKQAYILGFEDGLKQVRIKMFEFNHLNKMPEFIDWVIHIANHEGLQERCQLIDEAWSWNGFSVGVNDLKDMSIFNEPGD